MALVFTCCFEEHLNHVYFQCVPLLCAISIEAAGVAAASDLDFFFC